MIAAFLRAGALLTWFCLAVRAQNLLTNGNFSAGNTGFTSEYVFVNSGVSTTPGTYGIRTNSQSYNPNFNLFGDHTTGNGNMMLVDGHPTPNRTVWSETIPV